MTFKIGDAVQFERNRGGTITGTVTSIKGREPYRVIGVCGPGAAQNYLIPERDLRAARTHAEPPRR